MVADRYQINSFLSFRGESEVVRVNVAVSFCRPFCVGDSSRERPGSVRSWITEHTRVKDEGL